MKKTKLSRKKLQNTQNILQNQVLSLQKKIVIKIKLQDLLKLLETIRYIDRANETLSTLLVKANFTKIRELLLILDSGMKEKFLQIKILNNKFEQMVQLKKKFLETLVNLIKKEIEMTFSPVLDGFKDYCINYIPDVEIYKVEMDINNLAKINQMLFELDYFDQDGNFFGEIVDHFVEYFTQHNKNYMQILSQYLHFKTPSFDIIYSYKNVAEYLLQNYKILLSVKQKQDHFEKFIFYLKKNLNSFFKKLFDAFQLQDIEPEKMDKFLSILTEIEQYYQNYNKSLQPILNEYFKQVVLNARQHKFFQAIKNDMEQEIWEAVPIIEPVQNLLNKKFSDKKIEINQMDFKLEDDVYQFTKSFENVILYINELEILNTKIDGIQSEVENKIRDLFKIIFHNANYLLLGGAAMNFNKIKKINTKILSLITVQYNFLNVFLEQTILNKEDLKQAQEQITINKLKFLNKIKEIAKMIIQKFSQQLSEVDWDQKELQQPISCSQNIIKTVQQIYQAVYQTLLKNDLEYLFEEVCVLINDDVFIQIQKKAKIKTELSYKRLCEEMEFLEEQIEEFFTKQLNLDCQLIKKTIRNIESQKIKEI